MDDLREQIALLLKPWETKPHGDVRLNADRIAAKVMSEVVTPELERLRKEVATLRAENAYRLRRDDHLVAERDALKATIERIRRAVVDVYGEDYDGEDVAAEVERLFGHLSEHDINVGRLIGAKNEALARAVAERDAQIQRAETAEREITRVEGFCRDQRQRGDRAEAERNALKAAIGELRDVFNTADTLTTLRQVQRLIAAPDAPTEGETL